MNVLFHAHDSSRFGSFPTGSVGREGGVSATPTTNGWPTDEPNADRYLGVDQSVTGSRWDRPSQRRRPTVTVRPPGRAGPGRDEPDLCGRSNIEK
jgi:hypothetical protein